jgi:protease-4
MKQFFKFTLSVIVGTILTWILFLVFIAALAGSSSEDEKIISENSILRINMSMPVTESNINDPFAGLPFPGFDQEKPINFYTLLRNIDKAKNDNKIKGIVLTDAMSGQGSAQMQELRDKLQEFKGSGKFIYAYSDIYSQKGYWMSTVADSIFVNPIGGIDFKGLATEIIFFKEFGDKFGLKYDVIRHGKFKSAVEPFLNNEISEANKLQTSKYLNGIWKVMIDDIAESRKLNVETLNDIADKRSGDEIQDAFKLGLIDVIAYEDEFISFINSKLGKEGEKLETVSIKEYAKVKDENAPEYTRDRIAVLYAEGEIVYGSTSMGGPAIEPNNMQKTIIDLKNDQNVKAVVLRINSPGGSALSSEIIWRELELLKAKKPLIVSMGNVAASGGYYIACGADKIYADEATITGSIGVFGMIPNLEKAANNLGIRSDIVSTNKLAFESSQTKGASEEIKALIQKGVEQTYKVFISRVAEGRSLTIEQVDEIGQGRVWAAADAKEIGLVDEIGGLENAIAFAAEEVGLSNYRVVAFPEKEDDFKKFLEGLQSEAKTRLLKSELSDESFKLYQQFKRQTQREGIQAIMPYEVNIY